MFTKDYCFIQIERNGSFVEIIAELIQKSFSCFPWYEALSKEECMGRISTDLGRREFFGYLLLIEGVPVAANWVDVLSIEQITEQRGEKLRNFVEALNLNHIWWGRDLVVHPDYQMMGMGTQIRRHVIRSLELLKGGEYIFTRMRQDNLGSIKICEKLGYTKTGIKVPSSQISGLFHEYYYLKL